MAENRHDKGYRRMLGDRRNFLELVRSHVAAPWVEQLDSGSLELIDRSFVTKDFRDKEADIIYKASIGGADVVFYVLLELQSSVDFTMPFRLLVYIAELLRRLFAGADKKARRAKGFRLPAVVPIVLYNGSDKWSCAGSFREYTANSELFGSNILDFSYILLDVNEVNEDEFTKSPTLVNLAMLADRKGDPELVMGRIAKALKLGQRLTEDERVQLFDWIRDMLLRKADPKMAGSVIEAINRKGDTEMRAPVRLLVQTRCEAGTVRASHPPLPSSLERKRQRLV
jgi:hypothetical protein